MVSRLAADLLSGVSGRVLLTTIFGDALLPRQQHISVKALADLVEPFGINERLTRTSLQRMTSDGFVEADRVGRQSFYHVAPGAIDTFERANERIYTSPSLKWDDEWTIAVVDSDTSPSQRNQLRKELGWLGVRELSNGPYLSPNVAPATIAAIAQKLDTPLSVLMRGPLLPGADLHDRHLGELVDPDGDLTDRYEAYGVFLDQLQNLADSDTTEPAGFAVRTLLVDAWRRLALRAPSLPATPFACGLECRINSSTHRHPLRPGLRRE